MTVVIPFYDQHATLAAALGSLRHQSGLREIIVVDDASATPLRLEPDEEALPITVIRHHRNKGPAAARNTGVAAAGAALVAFLDADDTWLPQKTELQLAALAAAGEEALGCLSGYVIVRGQAGRRRAVAPPRFADGGRGAFLGGWIGAAGSTLMIRRAPFLALGGYDEALRHYEDWDLLLRASRVGRFAVVGRPLSVTMQPPDGASPLQADALEQIAAKHCPAERGWRRRWLEAALAYEQASMHYRNGARLKFLKGLLTALAKRPLHTGLRTARRVALGTP